MFTQICLSLAEEFDLPVSKIRAILMSFKKKLITMIENKTPFVLSGLFSVKFRQRAGFSRVNPFTKKMSDIKACTVVKMVPSKKIKHLE